MHLISGSKVVSLTCIKQLVGQEVEGTALACLPMNQITYTIIKRMKIERLYEEIEAQPEQQKARP